MEDILKELYETHVLMGMRKQRYLAEILGQHSYEFDRTNSVMAFPPGPSFSVQVLGIEKSDTDNWVWAWADDSLKVPATQVQAAQQLRVLGQEWGIKEWTVAELPRQELPAHTLAPVALGVLGLPAYYRCPVENNNLLLLIDDPKFNYPLTLKATEFVATLGDAISNCIIPDHRRAVEKFIEQLGWPGQWQEDVLEVISSDGVSILGKFDELNRLAKLSMRATSTA